MRKSRPTGKPTAAREGAPSVRRCAIYTRKSSEEGLEQAFNSLDAQREACEAYIVSQRHEGWTALPAFYDDGGISGGTLERPALQRLLADIAAGKVDLVVVYKVDRLTRSLGDFAKIVDVFDAQDVSFVSVTQQFNTTTSMGRLTLNMLLSFAQFAREVTGERIRDKIAASKRKGMWMGGSIPLGYDVVDRKLVINAPEAETVRHIFRRYLEVGTVLDLQAVLQADGTSSKHRPGSSARPGGGPLGRGALYTLLQNRLYRGEIAHKQAIYPGEHQAIVAPDLWEAVQQRLSEKRAQLGTAARAQHPSLLAGLLYDEAGHRLTPTHAVKGSRRYRYYVSSALISGRREAATQGKRIPATDLERTVVDRLRHFLGNEALLFDALASTAIDRGLMRPVLDHASALSRDWPDLPQPEQRRILTHLLAQIVVHPDQVVLHLRPEQLATLKPGSAMQALEDDQNATITLSVGARIKRAGLENRLLTDADLTPRLDANLIRVIIRARQVWEKLQHSALPEVAVAESLTKSYVTRLARLAFLAPDIVTAILTGQQPVELTANRLMQDTRLPLAWDQQRKTLGFPESRSARLLA